MIHVTSFKLIPREIKEDLKLTFAEQKDKRYIYIGSAMPRYGLEGSSFANYFKPSNGLPIEKCLDKYKKSFDKHFKEYKKSQKEFEKLYEQGNIIRDGFWFNFRLTSPISARIIWVFDNIKYWEKELGEIYLVCWCKKEMDDDTPCHGDVIRKFVEKEIKN